MTANERSDYRSLLKNHITAIMDRKYCNARQILSIYNVFPTASAVYSITTIVMK